MMHVLDVASREASRSGGAFALELLDGNSGRRRKCAGGSSPEARSEERCNVQDEEQGHCRRRQARGLRLAAARRQSEAVEGAALQKLRRSYEGSPERWPAIGLPLPSQRGLSNK